MGWKVPVFFRRLLTMIPALIVIAMGVNTLSTLIFSQVIPSMTLPFAIIPLIWLTSRRDVMGNMVNGVKIRTLAIIVAIVVPAMNVLLLAGAFL